METNAVWRVISHVLDRETYSLRMLEGGHSEVTLCDCLLRAWKRRKVVMGSCRLIDGADSVSEAMLRPRLHATSQTDAQCCNTCNAILVKGCMRIEHQHCSLCRTSLCR